MKALADLVMVLHGQGLKDLSAIDIYKAAQETDLKWLSRGYIEQKLNATVKAIRKDYRDCWPMPVAQPYLDAVNAGVAEFTIRAARWITSIHSGETTEEGEYTEFKRAYSYLPFFQATAGIRFARGRNDYLFFLYGYTHVYAAAKKEQSQLDYLGSAAAAGLIPADVWQQLIKASIFEIGKAIDGYPKQLAPKDQPKAALVQKRTLNAADIAHGMEKSWFKGNRGWSL